MAGEDEVRIDASLRDDISAALAKIEQRIESVERAVGQLGREGAKSGEEFAAGVDTAAEAADNLGDQARQAKRQVDDLGDKASKTGAKAAASSSGLDLMAKKTKKLSKEAGGLKTVLQAFKIAGLISGVFALAGGVSALGAGAAIAIGAISPMVGVIAGALPFFAAAKLSMLAWKLAATQLEPSLTRIKNQFTELGPVIAKGGLQQGLDYFANSVGKLARATGTGLAGLGGEIGTAAHNAGDLAKSAPFLNQVATIFDGLRPILKFVLSGLMAIAQAALNVLQAALPAAQGMAAAFEWVATSLRNWTAEQLANGKMTAFITRAWEMFIQVVGIVVDVVIGLYNVFKIAAGFAGNMGQSIHDAAWEFRQWTASAEGQRRITKYFQDSLPALQEMGKLLKFVVGGLAGLGANQNVAPLLAMINSQLLPALATLVQNLSGQGGLGPAVIQAATALAQLFSGLDFSGLTIFAQAIAGVLQALVWLQQNVPGANLVISALLFSMLGFKALGPVFSIVSKGFAAFGWMETALTATKGLTVGQRVFFQVLKGGQLAFINIGGAVVKYVLPALKGIATVGIGAIRALSTALFTTPIGWIILAIIAVIAAIWLLWTKCAWFRDAVMAVWSAIKTAAIATWNALVTAFNAVVNALVTAWNWVRDAAVAVWTAVLTAAQAVWNALKTAWQSTVEFLIMVGMWIWDHGLKQVISVIVGAFQIGFNIVKFIVQTVIFFIAVQVKIVATIAEAMWKGLVIAAKFFADVATWVWGKIVEGVQWAVGIVTGWWNSAMNALSTAWNWLWSTAIKPIIDLFVAAWNNTVTTLTQAWNLLTGIVAAGWNWLWTTIIKPVIDFFVWAWNGAVTGISNAANWLWTGITSRVQAFWDWISPFFTWVGNAGSRAWQIISDTASSIWDSVTGVWNRLTGFLGGVFDKLKSAGTGVWDAIKSAANTVGDVISGVWNSITGAVKGVWNFIARGWNSIPSVSIPDWVPIMGGKTFSLPKLPMLWRGGEVDGGGRALVGEHGPEPLIKNGRLAGMVGMNGPEITGIPKGGYVVPNLRTLNALPGLAKTLPSGVAAAVARSVPGYAGALSGGSPGGNGGSGATAVLAAQVGRLAHAVAHQQAPLSVSGGEDVYSAVLEAQRTLKREENLRKKYHYGEN